MAGGGRRGPASPHVPKATVVVELEGNLDVVFEEGSALLGLVPQLRSARLASVRVDYGDESAEHPLDEDRADVLELLGRGTDRADEARFWTLALQAADQILSPEARGGQ